MLSGIVGAYIVFWCPYMIATSIRYCEALFMKTSIMPEDVPIILYLKKITYLNSTANPIIYFLLGKDFRRAAKKILAKRDEI